jgi:hypothetical protein
MEKVRRQNPSNARQHSKKSAHNKDSGGFSVGAFLTFRGRGANGTIRIRHRFPLLQLMLERQDADFDSDSE